VLLISVLLYIFRRVFQDGKPIALREETPVLPPPVRTLPSDLSKPDYDGNLLGPWATDPQLNMRSPCSSMICLAF
jgi:hypothetical protein